MWKGCFFIIDVVISDHKLVDQKVSIWQITWIYVHLGRGWQSKIYFFQPMSLRIGPLGKGS